MRKAQMVAEAIILIETAVLLLRCCGSSQAFQAQVSAFAASCEALRLSQIRSQPRKPSKSRSRPSSRASSTVAQPHGSRLPKASHGPGKDQALSSGGRVQARSKKSR